MKQVFGVLVIFLLLLGCEANPPEEAASTELSATRSRVFETTGTIESLDSTLVDIIDPNAAIEIIASGFNWSEGPVWVPALEALLFSDVPENKIYKWTEEDSISVFLKPSGYTGLIDREGEPGSNGLTLNAAGELLLCQHGDRRVAKLGTSLTNPQPNYITVAREYQGSLFNSPNDLCLDQAGNIYFTDPPYGLEGGVEDSTKALAYQGVFKIDTSGQVTLLTKSLSRPNGIALSPDETTLYVANSDPEKALWMAYPIQEDGSLGVGTVLYDATAWSGKEKGLPDGLKVNRAGYIFATGPGGVWVFSPEGAPIGKIKTGQATANVALNKEETILYITADMHLMRVKLKG